MLSFPSISHSQHGLLPDKAGSSPSLFKTLWHSLCHSLQILDSARTDNNKAAPWSDRQGPICSMWTLSQIQLWGAF